MTAGHRALVPTGDEVAVIMRLRNLPLATAIMVYDLIANLEPVPPPLLTLVPAPYLPVVTVNFMDRGQV